MADVSVIESIDNEPSREDTRKYENINFAINQLVQTNNVIFALEAKLNTIPLFPHCYGPNEMEEVRKELIRFKEERTRNQVHSEIRSDVSYAQALNSNSQQQMEPLDGESTEPTPTTEQRKPRNKNTENNKAQNGFSMFDAIKELKSFFILFPGLLQACEKMSKVSDKNDKLNIFLQGICTQI
ncbi:hypothetical protein NPIL_538471 [Nephila pilipes]|uniref:Uncharacterized protein n=1 Tax=Nephila pilipes TaxID=299642 RepID=A0A8X6NVS1_NEPPI|nr:hypothetical protein NPIL_538471 [Nephila pilipes]